MLVGSCADLRPCKALPSACSCLHPKHARAQTQTLAARQRQQPVRMATPSTQQRAALLWSRGADQERRQGCQGKHKTRGSGPECQPCRVHVRESLQSGPCFNFVFALNYTLLVQPGDRSRGQRASVRVSQIRVNNITPRQRRSDLQLTTFIMKHL